MNILFLTIAYHEGERNIYTDLMQEFRDRGDDVYVVCSRERRHRKPTELKTENGISVLRVRTGNLTKTNIFVKGISTLLIEQQFIKAINKYFSGVKFDLVIYSTPPITFEKTVRHVKCRDGSHTYLLLKDIFPQNAVDIGMMRKGSLIWRYFLKKEKQLYAISDYIGCMSPANVKYVLKHNPEISQDRIEVCPNSIRPRPLSIVNLTERRKELREKYGIPSDVVLFVYGGNLGKPQGIPFLLDVLDTFKERKDIFFLVVGSGTEYGKVEVHLKKSSHQNAKLIKHLPKQDYDILLTACDVGLIFLDRRFTIPNFPSRLTAYMEACLPVAAATDINTDIKDVLREAGCGLWAESGDLKGFKNVIEVLAADDDKRREMGLKGRRYLEKYYTVSNCYDIITAHFKEQTKGCV